VDDEKAGDRQRHPPPGLAVDKLQRQADALRDPGARRPLPVLDEQPVAEPPRLRREARPFVERASRFERLQAEERI
jgi:hypothetical protein